MTIKEVSEAYGITADTLRYYERIGMLPPVTRTGGGIRDYTEEDRAWLELVLCMRSAGLAIEAITQYVRLYREGDGTMRDRLELLKAQRDELLAQKAKIESALTRLDFKISRYETAVETGVLSWEKGSCEDTAETNEKE